MHKETRKIYNRAIQDGIPILIGNKQGNQLVVWCPFCRKFHWHGYGEGYKSAHCSSANYSLFNGFVYKTYCCLDIENLKNKEGKLEDPTYYYDKCLDHIEGHREMMKKRYRIFEKFNDKSLN